MAGFWQRLFGRRDAAGGPGIVLDTPAAESLSEDSRGEAIAELTEAIRAGISAGFRPRSEILESAVERVEDQLGPALARRESERLWSVLVAEHLASQVGWPKVTDCDRLDAAFAALEIRGVIARQNFTCCGTCGSAEIGDEIDEARRNGLPADGYTFFHQQDTDHAVDGHGLYLNFGACVEGEQAALAIGRGVVAEFERQGLTPHWNGSWQQRIYVPIVWQKRIRADGRFD